MNECERIHETIIRDIYDVVNDVKDYDQVEWLQKKNGTGSIARRASNFILTFPVIVSTSLTIETATIIAKALERKCVSLMQILFASMQLSDAENLQDYIKKFHTNLNMKRGMTLDDWIDFTDTLVDEGAVTISDVDMYNAVKEDMKNLNFYLSEEYNPQSINDYRVKKNIYGESYVTKVHENEFDGSYTNNKSTRNQKGNHDNLYGAGNDYSKGWGGFNNVRGVGDTGNAAYDASTNKELSNGYKLGTQFRKDKRDAKKNNKNAVPTNGSGGSSSSYQDRKYKVNQYYDLKSQTDYFRYQLTQADINKANELMPTTMQVNFISVKDGVNVQQSGIIGIKCKLYPVDSTDIVNRIAAKYSESNGLFNLIRATTREISFFRDLAFAVDKAKLDAINMSRESNNARLFRVLERRRSKNKLFTLLKRNDASPITSLVMSQDEVEYLKKYHNINMDNPAIARTMLDRYNLMDIVLADETLETAKFLFDDDSTIFEVLPFDALEKEAKDSSYKKVVNLMNKINR